MAAKSVHRCYTEGVPRIARKFSERRLLETHNLTPTEDSNLGSVTVDERHIEWLLEGEVRWTPSVGQD